jgi:hypothetical protein
MRRRASNMETGFMLMVVGAVLCLAVVACGEVSAEAMVLSLMVRMREGDEDLVIMEEEEGETMWIGVPTQKEGV